MDIRRTILLMIFSFSLLMLWNSWQVHQGNPPLFGAPPPKAAPAATAPPAESGTASGQAGVPNAPAQASPPSGRSIDRSSNGAKRATVTAQTGPEQLDFFNHSHAEISPQCSNGIAGLVAPMVMEHRPIIIDSAGAAGRFSKSRVNRMRA